MFKSFILTTVLATSAMMSVNSFASDYNVYVENQGAKELPTNYFNGQFNIIDSKGYLDKKLRNSKFINLNLINENNYERLQDKYKDDIRKPLIYSTLQDIQKKKQYNDYVVLYNKEFKTNKGLNVDTYELSGEASSDARDNKILIINKLRKASKKMGYKNKTNRSYIVETINSLNTLNDFLALTRADIDFNDVTNKYVRNMIVNDNLMNESRFLNNDEKDFAYYKIQNEYGFDPLTNLDGLYWIESTLYAVDIVDQNIAIFYNMTDDGYFVLKRIPENEQQPILTYDEYMKTQN
ncbi:TPA: hypothetical protein ACX6QN_003775 [Photobacterium damselae]